MTTYNSTKYNWDNFDEEYDNAKYSLVYNPDGSASYVDNTPGDEGESADDRQLHQQPDWDETVPPQFSKNTGGTNIISTRTILVIQNKYIGFGALAAHPFAWIEYYYNLSNSQLIEMNVPYHKYFTGGNLEDRARAYFDYVVFFNNPNAHPIQALRATTKSQKALKKNDPQYKRTNVTEHILYSDEFKTARLKVFNWFDSIYDTLEDMSIKLKSMLRQLDDDWYSFIPRQTDEANAGAGHIRDDVRERTRLKTMEFPLLLESGAHKKYAQILSDWDSNQVTVAHRVDPKARYHFWEVFTTKIVKFVHTFIMNEAIIFSKKIKVGVSEGMKTLGQLVYVEKSPYANDY